MCKDAKLVTWSFSLTKLLEIVIRCVVLLAKVEFDLKLCCLETLVYLNVFDVILIHLGSSSCELVIDVLRFVQHLVQDRVFGQVLNFDVEYIFAGLAVCSTHKSLHNLELVQFLSNQICCVVHSCHN